ncbi:MAG: hypothetical protein ACTHZX_13190 [Microbacterium sp.]
MTAPLTAHPGFTRALAAVRGAEIGLLRAAMLDVVAIGEGDALRRLGPEAIDVLRNVTGSTSVDLQAHSTADGGATTFLGRAGRGIAVSAHLSLVAGEGRRSLRARIRLVGTHGSVLVDLLHPLLEVRTGAGRSEASFGVLGEGAPAPEASEALSAIAGSARSGRTATITW